MDTSTSSSLPCRIATAINQSNKPKPPAQGACKTFLLCQKKGTKRFAIPQLEPDVPHQQLGES
jgi:hypothetical protein